MLYDCLIILTQKENMCLFIHPSVLSTEIPHFGQGLEIAVISFIVALSLSASSCFCHSRSLGIIWETKNTQTCSQVIGL